MKKILLRIFFILIKKKQKKHLIKELQHLQQIQHKHIGQIIIEINPNIIKNKIGAKWDKYIFLASFLSPVPSIKSNNFWIYSLLSSYSLSSNDFPPLAKNSCTSVDVLERWVERLPDPYRSDLLSKIEESI